MAIFPITMGRAAAIGGHSHAATAQIDHGDHVHLASGTDCTSLATDDDRAPSESASHESAPSCCSMGACHAFQMSAALSVSTPAGPARVIRAPGDQQVSGAFSVRIDRPPRTV
jgi:hypothetical protein